MTDSLQHELMLVGFSNTTEYSPPRSEILKDKNVYYHGIGGFNVVVLDSILRHGILTPKNIEESRMWPNKTNMPNLGRNYGGFNGTNKVSIAESPHFSTTPGAFNTYVLDGLAVVIDVNKIPQGVHRACSQEMAPYGEHTTLSRENISSPGFEDELYVSEKVDKAAILGIMVSEKALDLPLTAMSINRYTRPYLLRERVWMTINALRENYGFYSDDTGIENALKKLDCIADNETPDELLEATTADIDARLASYMEAAFISLTSKNPLTLLDVLNFICPPSLCFYNEKGESIKREIG